MEVLIVILVGLLIKGSSIDKNRKNSRGIGSNPQSKSPCPGPPRKVGR